MATTDPNPHICLQISSSEPDQPLIFAESDRTDEVDQATMPSQPNIPDLYDSNVEMSTDSSTESSFQSSFDHSDESALSPVADTTVLGDLVPSLHSDVVGTVNMDTNQYSGANDELSSVNKHAQHSDEIAQNLPPFPELHCTDSSLQANASTCRAC